MILCQSPGCLNPLRMQCEIQTGYCLPVHYRLLPEGTKKAIAMQEHNAIEKAINEKKAEIETEKQRTESKGQ